MIERVVSGGQTGVDRAALDAALARGLACGGWCPKGRRAEDGVIPNRYPLNETESADYRLRTQRNVSDSDGTLILAIGELTGGTALTREIALAQGKPLLVVDLDTPSPTSGVCEWIQENHIRRLNVAGPRESLRPGIADRAREFLAVLFAEAGSPLRGEARSVGQGEKREPGHE
ncbi:MAG: putative molybdenum carrier protein [Gammaproteobacteria bacterium]|nr:putative molybdenum carrier protein [Gammaproteobacteria bacterium]